MNMMVGGSNDTLLNWEKGARLSWPVLEVVEI